MHRTRVRLNGFKMFTFTGIDKQKVLTTLTTSEHAQLRPHDVPWRTTIESEGCDGVEVKIGSELFK